jgi:hypothetical protein
LNSQELFLKSCIRSRNILRSLTRHDDNHSSVDSYNDDDHDNNNNNLSFELKESGKLTGGMLQKSKSLDKILGASCLSSIKKAPY